MNIDSIDLGIREKYDKSRVLYVSCSAAPPLYDNQNQCFWFIAPLYDT